MIEHLTITTDRLIMLGKMRLYLAGFSFGIGVAVGAASFDVMAAVIRLLLWGRS